MIRPMPFDEPIEPDLDADSQQERQLNEQVALLYRHAPSLFFGNLAGGLGIALMLWENTPRSQMLRWLAVLAMVTLGRIVLVYFFRTYGRSRLPMLIWGWLFVAGAAASGLVWGSLSMLSFETSPADLAGVGVVLAGLVAASSPALGAFFPAYLSFAIPAILPFVLRSAQASHSMSTGMAVVGVAFLISSLIFGWLNSRTILRSIQLRFDNLELMRQLREQSREAVAARQQAENANAAKTRFLAAASHDLRQPLQSITLLAETLMLEPVSDNSKHLLAGIQDASASMSQLMNELLDYAHIHAGGLRPEPSDFDLSTLLRRILAEFTPLARDKRLRLRLRCPRLSVRSDVGMLERVLRNLLSNAIKYTHHGGVLLGVRQREDVVRIEIWDTGIGIPQAMLDDVFHEFYQLDNPERDSRKGLGLGLAIVASLSQLLDTRLSVRSREGKGSVFTLEIALSKNAVLPQQAPRPARIAQRGSGSVLVIDNEPAIVQAMCSLLAAWGYHTIAAETPEHALRLLSTPPDAILADFRLREGQTGIEAIKIVRRHFSSEIPAALITGDTDPHRLSEARACGLPLLQKPTPSAALHKLVSQLINGPEPLADARLA